MLLSPLITSKRRRRRVQVDSLLVHGVLFCSSRSILCLVARVFFNILQHLLHKVHLSSEDPAIALTKEYTKQTRQVIF